MKNNNKNIILVILSFVFLVRGFSIIYDSILSEEQDNLNTSGQVEEQVKVYTYISKDTNKNYGMQMYDAYYESRQIKPIYDVYATYIKQNFNMIISSDYSDTKASQLKQIYFYDSNNIICGVKFEQSDINDINLLEIYTDNTIYKVDGQEKVISEIELQADNERILELLGYKLIEEKYDVMSSISFAPDESKVKAKILNKRVALFGPNQEELNLERKTIDELNIIFSNDNVLYTEILHTGEVIKSNSKAYTVSKSDIDNIKNVAEKINENNFFDIISQIETILLNINVK